MKENESLMKYIGNKIKTFRNSLGWSQDKLAEKMNVSKQTVSRWELGQRNILPKSLFKLAGVMGKTADDFYPDDNIEDLSVDMPCYGSVAAGALAEINGVRDDLVSHVKIPESILGKHAKDKGLFMMKVNGESMNKVIPNGSYVIARPDSDPQENDIVIFSHDEGYSLKRFKPYDIAGSVLFKAETTDSRIKDIVINLDDEIETRIYGKVIWYGVALE